MKEKDEWSFENPVKKHSTEEIERIFSESISDLVGENLNVNIKFIDYNPSKKGVSLGKDVEIHLTLSTPSKDFLK